MTTIAKRRTSYVVAAAAVFIALATLLVSLALSRSSAAEESPGLATDDVVSLEAIDPDEAVEVGWPATVDEIEGRAVAWYSDEGVAQASDEELERAIGELSDAIRNPPTTEEPAKLMYITEISYRREAACRSLSPENPIQGEYCSATSVPNLDDRLVPWEES